MGIMGQPKPEDLNRLLERLDHNGYFIFECLGRPFESWMSKPNSFKTIATEYEKYLKRKVEVSQTPVSELQGYSSIVYLIRAH